MLSIGLSSFLLILFLCVGCTKKEKTVALSVQQKKLAESAPVQQKQQIDANVQQKVDQPLVQEPSKSIFSKAVETISKPTRPKFVEEYFMGKSKQDFESVNGALVPVPSQWCKESENCSAYRKDARVVGGSFAKEIWVKNSKIYLVTGELSVYPSQLHLQQTIGEYLDKDEVAPDYVFAMPDDGGETVVASWEFGGGWARITGYCAGGLKTAKSKLKNLRQCVYYAIWIKECKSGEECRVLEKFRKHDAEF